MNKQILVVYKSVTGFTKQYAQWIAEELDCSILDFKEVSAKTLSEYKVIIFGGRFHAGFVDGLKKTKEIFEKSSATRLIVFATGAPPDTETAMIEEAWKNNFTPDESKRISHFYMQSGLRYKKMPLGDKLMLKAFSAMVKRKKDKTEYEKAMERALENSYDLSSKEYIKPLIACAIDEKNSPATGG